MKNIINAYYNFVEKNGIDKFAHLGVGGMITSIIINIMVIGFKVVSFWWLLFGLIMSALVVFGLSYWKEKKDKHFEWIDIWFAEYGVGLASVIVMISYLIGLLF